MSKSNEPSDVFKLYDMSGGPNTCWRYTGAAWGGQAREKRPYFMARRRRMIAYRWIYELVNGVTLTPDQLILHSCDQGGWPVGCGNPAHLRVGDVQQNTDDMMQRERHGLPRSVVNAIRTLLEQGRTQHEIAELYGVSRECISSVATGRVYKHGREAKREHEASDLTLSSTDDTREEGSGEGTE